MADNAQSQFVLMLDTGATGKNRQPSLIGYYRLAGEEINTRLSLWSNVASETQQLYARGKAQPDSVSAALRGKADLTRSATLEHYEAPPNVNLKAGEVVIFQDNEATAENRRPNFWGYAREPNRYVRLAGWEHGSVITGTAEPYRSGPAQSEPQEASPSGAA